MLVQEKDRFSQASKTAKKLPIQVVVSELILVMPLAIGGFHEKAKKLAPWAKKLANHSSHYSTDSLSLFR